MDSRCPRASSREGRIHAGCRVTENGAEGETSTESFNEHFIGDNQSLLHDASDLWRVAADQQMAHYNRRWKHMTLRNAAPMTYIIRKEILPQLATGPADL